MQRRELIKQMLLGAGAVPLLCAGVAAAERPPTCDHALAIDADGNITMKNVKVTSPPTFHLTARPDDNSPKARLDWDDPGFPVHHYVLNYNVTEQEWQPGGYRQLTCGQLTLRNTRTTGFVVEPGRRYTFYVAAVSAVPEGPQTVFSDTATYLPGAVL